MQILGVCLSPCRWRSPRCAVVRVQVRSFAKENASCERYGVSQKQVLRWGLKSAHASGAILQTLNPKPPLIDAPRFLFFACAPQHAVKRSCGHGWSALLTCLDMAIISFSACARRLSAPPWVCLLHALHLCSSMSPCYHACMLLHPGFARV